jgi:hypothetical protein
MREVMSEAQRSQLAARRRALTQSVATGERGAV